jgi:DNA-binding CsgD family transcriptional regulator
MLTEQTCERAGPTCDTTVAVHPVRLSRRKQEVLQLLQRGLNEKEIAWELRISPNTVHVHVKALYQAFNVNSRSELLALTLAGWAPLQRPRNGATSSQRHAGTCVRAKIATVSPIQGATECMDVQIRKRGRLIVERARMLAYTLSTSLPEMSLWAGALALDRPVAGEDILAQALEVELPDGVRAQIEVHWLFGGFLAHFSGLGPPPPGLI